MIVDDDAGICEVLVDLLEMEGYKPVVACDGRQALDKIFKLKRPALIFLDLRMPKMSGQEFLTELRQHKFGHNGELDHVVVMTAGNASKIQVPEADAILQKPMEINQVLNLVEQYMEPGVIEQAKRNKEYKPNLLPESNYL